MTRSIQDRPVPGFFSAFSVAVLGAVPLAAQATLHVSPTGPFTEIGAAVAAANPGDTILVQSGTYASFTVTEAISVLGDSAGGVFVTGGFEVRNVPVGGAVHIANLELVQSSSSSWIRDNDAPVHLDHVQSLRTFGFTVERCELVTMSRCTLRGGPIVLDARSSTVLLDGCTLVNEPVGVSGSVTLRCFDSLVELGATTVLGAPPNALLFATPGAVLLSGTLRLGAGTLVQSGANAITVTPGITTFGGTLEVDAGAAIVGAGTSMPVFGSVQPTPVLLGSTRSSGGTIGAALAGEVRGPSGAFGVTFLGFPAPAAPTIAGSIWTSQPVVFDVGPIGAGGARPYSVAVPASVPPGTAILTQALLVTPSAFTLSVPAVSVLAN